MGLKYCLVSVFFVLAVLHSNAQIINFSEYDLFRGHRFGKIVPLDDDTFFTLTYNKVNMSYAIPKIRMYKGNRMIKEDEFEKLEPINAELDQDFFLFQNQLVLLTESKQFGKHSFFIYSKDTELEQEGKRFQLQSLSLKPSETVVKSGLTVSPDSSKLLFFALTEEVQSRTYYVHYSILDENLESIESSSKSYIFPSANIELHSMHLSDDLDALAVFTLFAKRASRLHNFYLDRLAYFFVDLKKESNNTVRFSLPEKNVIDLKIIPKNHKNWLVSGLWRNPDDTQTGIFVTTFNSNQNKYSNEHEWVYTSNDNIKSNISSQNDKNYFHSAVSSKSKLNRFIVRELIALERGYLLVCEESYVYGRIIEYDTGGRANNLTFHNNNIVLIHFNLSGEILWSTEIVKSMQHNTENYDTHSFFVQMNRNKLLLFFNDNKKNYNDSFAYNEKNVSISHKKSDLVITKTTVDLTNGTLSREMLVTADAKQGFFLPMKSAASGDNTHVVLVFRQKLDNLMYRFGVLRVD